MEYEIIKYDTSDKNWLNRRKNYIGASDFGVMLGQDTYKSALKLWQEKVGIIDELSKTTDAGLLGHVMEVPIADEYWQHGVFYNDGTIDPELTKKNIDKRIKLRKCKKLDQTLIPLDRPYLGASIDREIVKHDTYEGKGAIECKSSLSSQLNQWVDGVPLKFVYQCQIQMYVVELDYVELCILNKDNAKFRRIKIERDQEMIDLLLKKVDAFWKTVEDGRLLYAKIKEYEELTNIRELNEKESKHLEKINDALYNRLAPPLDYTDKDFEKHILARRKPDIQFVDGLPGDELYDIALEHKRLEIEIKELEEKKENYRKQMFEKMIDVEGYDYQDQGRVYLTPKGRFYNKIKLN